jgi:nitrogen regulatory protein P-II 2
MRKIEAIIKPEALGAVVSALSAAGLDDLTISAVQGRGRHPGDRQFYRGAVYPIDTFAKLRIELAVGDERVDEVVSLLCRVARTRGLGNGKVLVTPVLDAESRGT